MSNIDELSRGGRGKSMEVGRKSYHEHSIQASSSVVRLVMVTLKSCIQIPALFSCVFDGEEMFACVVH